MNFSKLHNNRVHSIYLLQYNAPLLSPFKNTLCSLMFLVYTREWTTPPPARSIFVRVRIRVLGFYKLEAFGALMSFLDLLALDCD